MFINGQPGPIQGWPPDAEPVKSRPAGYTLNAVIPGMNQLAAFAMAKRVTLPAQSITMVPVRLQGQPNPKAIHLVTLGQRFGEYLVVPEGLYDQCNRTTDTYQVLVVNEGEQPLLLDAGRTMVGAGQARPPDCSRAASPSATGHGRASQAT